MTDNTCFTCRKELAAGERLYCDPCAARTCAICDGPKPADGLHTCRRCRARA
jgi:hypothetical protein